MYEKKIYDIIIIFLILSFIYPPLILWARGLFEIDVGETLNLVRLSVAFAFIAALIYFITKRKFFKNAYRFFSDFISDVVISFIFLIFFMVIGFFLAMYTGIILPLFLADIVLATTLVFITCMLFLSNHPGIKHRILQLTGWMK